MKFLLTILLFSCGFTLLSQNQNITVGQIINGLTKMPVEGAIIESGNEKKISDKNGFFSLGGHHDSIHISCLGFQKIGIKRSNDSQKLDISLMPDAIELDEVVVSGNMRAMRKLNSPLPVESYSAGFFQKNPTNSVFEAVGLINGVQNQLTCNVCNTGEIRINGLDGPYTMVLIDGMPIVSNLSTVYGLNGIPNSMVKRIEVVKGPASTLYGSEAMAGLINIITTDPLTAERFSADIQMTSLHELNADLGTKFKIGKATGLLGVNMFNYTNPVDINKDNFTDIALQKRISIFNKWGFDRKNNLPSSLAIRLLSEKRWGGEMDFRPDQKGSSQKYGEYIETKRAEIIGQIGIHNDVIAEYSYNYHFQDSYYGDRYYQGKQQTGFTQIRWNKKAGKHYLLAGLPVKLTWYDDNTPATEKETGKNDPSLQKMAGLFFQDEYNINDKFTILSGIRYEFTNIQGSILAPRIALKWQPSPDETIRLSGGNGFRVVNLFTEDHASLSGFREVVIEDDLKPEKSWNINLNHARQYRTNFGVINTDMTAFYTWFTNRILPDYDSDPQKIIYNNLDGRAVSKGFSANADLISNTGWKAGMGFTYLDVYTKEANDNGQIEKTQQVYSAKWSGTFSLGYSLKNSPTSFDLTGNWQGPMRLPVFPNDFRDAYSPLYALVNLKISHKFNHDFEVYAVGKNLLNFIPNNPILHPDDPFDKPGGAYWLNDGNPNPVTNPNGYSFDPTYNYAPMQGIKLMVGIRVNIH